MANTVENPRAGATERTSHKRETDSGTAHLDAVEGTFTSGLGRYENVVLAFALAVLTAFSLSFAWREPFSVDEYLVRITALSGSPGAVWNLLRTAPLAVDPPLYHFLNVYCLRLFGPTEFATRLPSALAYTLMTFFLYRFVRRYADGWTGLAVVALCLQCGTFAYGYEARPYTLVLAADAMALVCWAILIEKRQKRNVARAGLFLAIAIAVGSHWFGFLVLAPFAIAEAVRIWQERRIDIAVWVVLAGGAATALAYLPLLRAASKYKALPWKGVQLSDIPESFRMVLEPYLFPLALLLIALALGRVLFSTRPDRKQASPLPTPVLVCMAAFALAPFWGFMVGKLVTHAFQPRYALSCTIGLVPLVALAMRDAARRNVILMAIAVLIVGGYASFSHYRELSGTPSGGDAANFANTSILSANTNLPIVPSGNDLFLRLEAHAPEPVRERCVFPIDQDMVRLLHQNTNFLMTEGLRQWTKLPIVDLAPFLKTHPQFYLVQQSGGQGWLLQWLLEGHAEIALQGYYAGNPVYLVQLRR